MTLLKCTFFVARDVSMITGVLRNNLINKGNTFLRPHRMRIDVFPWGPADPIEIDFEGTINATGWRAPPYESDAQGIAQRNRLRKAAQTAYPQDDGRLKVIFCNVDGNGSEAVGSLGAPSDFPPYVIVAAGCSFPDGLTLVHEMGHCAGLHHANEYDIDNIMGYGLNRTIMFSEQAEALRKASFHAAM